MSAAYHDLGTLLRLRATVLGCDPDAEPLVAPAGPVAEPPRSVAYLAGSFNPPHRAHLALLAAAAEAGHPDLLLSVISVRTVDKERPTGLGLPDRLLLMGLLSAERPGWGVALVNRGLYADQVRALRLHWPTLHTVSVVVGYDKLVQILDPRYYADRDAALDVLFGGATLLVAPRADANADAVGALLRQPANARYASGVRPLPLATPYSEMSSTRLRALAAAGDSSAWDLPPVVAAFLAETGAYAPPTRTAAAEEIDRYALRVALIEALAQAPAAHVAGVDLAALVAAASADTPAGRDLRTRLATGEPVLPT